MFFLPIHNVIELVQTLVLNPVSQANAYLISAFINVKAKERKTIKYSVYTCMILWTLLILVNLASQPQRWNATRAQFCYHHSDKVKKAAD